MHSLTINRIFDLPTEKLFNAWLKPEVLQRWFAPGSMTVPSADVEPVEGGHYRIVMENENAEQFIVSGQYQSILPHSELIFSWQWEGSPETSHVSLKFRTISDTQCELTLYHSELASEEDKLHHNDGWVGCFANLEAINF